MRKFYRRADVVEMTGVSDTTLDRWSRRLRATHMVTKPAGGRVLFTPDFVKFIAARVGSQGPSNLPSPQQIAQLFIAWRICAGDISCVAERLNTNKLMAKVRLTVVGILEGELYAEEKI